jgi:aspartate beta-hydroxylase
MSALPERFAAYIATLRDAGDTPSLAHYPDLPSQAWYDPRSLPIAGDLERHAPQIIAEYRALDPAQFTREKEPIARDGAWDVFILYERGRKHDDRTRRTPTVAAIVEQHRTVRSLAGLVYFSRLAPHTHVAPHRGPTNMRVRIHLGIDVPANCGIRVNDVPAKWLNGACIAFDDSLPHAVWNESDRERIVLVVDVWHPDLSDDEVRLIEGLHRYIARSAEGLQRYWSMNQV